MNAEPADKMRLQQIKRTNSADVKHNAADNP